MSTRSIPSRAPAVVAAVGIAVLAALGTSCSSSDSGSTAPPTKGALALTVAGLPAGLAGSVALTGPDTNYVASATSTYLGLTPGDYLLTAFVVSQGSTTFGGTPFQQTITVPNSLIPVRATVTYSMMTGELVVIVNSAGAAAPSVKVTGPFGYTHVITVAGATTLTALPLGTYVVAPANVSDGAAIYVPTPLSIVDLTSAALRLVVNVVYVPATFAIAFVSGGEVYAMNADGTTRVDLTNNVASESSPAWSPDGSKLAFVSARSGHNEIYVMHADGSGLVDASNDTASDYSPVWSPDGSKLAFLSYANSTHQILVVNADGTGETALTAGDNGTPAWSPDGTKIAFVKYGNGGSQIYVMNADGSAQVGLTDTLSTDGSPAWSPDGTKIAFVTTRTGNNEIFTMAADGTSLTNLTGNAASDVSPVWSPDGARIAFISTRAGTVAVFTMNADGSGAAQLSHAAGTGPSTATPAWSPDGSQIAFIQYHTGKRYNTTVHYSQVVVANANGTSPAPILRNSVEFSPTWRPSPK